MNENTVYWIWLQQCLGAGTNIDEIVGYYENPRDLYFAGETDRRLSGVFTPLQIKKIDKNKMKEAELIFGKCEELGCGIVTPDDEKYPKLLKMLINYPLVLYTMGDISVLNKTLPISIVGTRRASDNGLEIASRLSSSLARAGVTVVSGGAYGVDSAAHLGAIREKGKTVAVLGCGFLAKYKDGIKDIRDDIIENGAVISEFHPETEARGYNFPIRNRIIAGASKGTVVVEAATKSGSLITADLALKNGRDVFAVPGNAANLGQMGTVGLIRDGAVPVFSSYDILSQYVYSDEDKVNWDKVENNLLYNNEEKIDFSKIKYGVKKIFGNDRDIPQKEYRDVPVAEEIIETAEDKTEIINSDKAKGLSENARKVLGAFGKGDRRVDEICEKTLLPMPKILSSLTELEIKGIIESRPGHIYRMKAE